MTRKKYKKVLMSFGVPRNVAADLSNGMIPKVIMIDGKIWGPKVERKELERMLREREELEQ